ncbi:MAG: FtsK/SpoIIIE domain-containing protein [Phycisphaerales bacterium]
MNDPDSILSVSVSAMSDHRPGYDAQADAFALLRIGLDEYANRIDSATTLRKETINAVEENRDRQLKLADTKLAEKLVAIEQRKVEAQTKLDDKYDGKLEALKLEHDQRIHQTRGGYNNGVQRAKKVREESAWMADTIYESSFKKAQNEHDAFSRDLSDLQKTIEEQFTQLMVELGPARAAKVAQGSDVHQALPGDVTLDGLRTLVHNIDLAISNYKDGGIRKLIRGGAKSLELGIEASNQIINAKAYTLTLQDNVATQHELILGKMSDARKIEYQNAERKYQQSVLALDTKAGEQVRLEHEKFTSQSEEIQKRVSDDTSEIESWYTKQLETAHEKHRQLCEDAKSKCANISDVMSKEYEAELASGRERVAELTRVALSLIKGTQELAQSSNPDWLSALESEHATTVPRVISIANGHQDLEPALNRFAESIRGDLVVPMAIDTPVVWSLPGQRSLIIRHGSQGREQALSTMRNSILRILASFPAGKVRFMLADPIGIGQSFAEFMTLSDQEPSPVGQRIWADPQPIERQLSDITEHMQTVIQKYLRADYETIEEYNIAAGEISEPYRFVVIADLPEALTEIGAARLKSILESGPRCGVYALLSTTAGSKLPSNLNLEELRSNTVVLEINDSQIAFDDDRFDGVSISLLEEPDDRIAAQLLTRIGQAGLYAGNVEVPFERLVPDADAIWSQSCADELVIPIGRSGAHKNQELRLGLGTRQHALIAGRTGSGKSTLLHVIISAAMLWHSPDELELYLIDFKKGVEFKAYTGNQAPHVRAVAIESDREFGLSVLKRLDDEMTTRGDLFRKLGAQNLASARSMAPEERLPRVLLLIDEFQEFFTEDDDVASEATLLLDRLIRQGRAFGVHVILGSQTLAGSYSLARSTLGQIGVRIALQCSEADSYLILGEDNNAARLLERPGEAIYNNAGGLVEGNSPFQTAWLSDAERDESLVRMPNTNDNRTSTVVFEGNRPAQFDVSVEAFVQAYPNRTVPRVLLGDAVAIAPPTSAPLLKRSGSNLLIVGQQPEPSLGMLVSAAITAGSTPCTRLIVIDPTPEDDAIHGRIGEAIEATGINTRFVTHKEADQVVEEVRKLVEDRNDIASEPVILVLAGLHRLRSLRKSDDYSFSMEEAKVSPDKDLVHILREGPAVGVWALAWCDTLTNLERAMERTTIREFGLRALMQMSASDSASLIDTSVASTLGANRAILADDVEGTLQKFRPINLPDMMNTKNAAKFLDI